MPHLNNIVIVGGGPVGALLSLYLAQKGYNVDVYEKRSDPRSHLQPAGRSINLALSVRGLSALKEVGVERQLFSLAVPMRGRMVHLKEQIPHFIPYSPNQDNVIYSISRLELAKLLLEWAGRSSRINLKFNEECLGLNVKTDMIEFKNTEEQREHRRQFSLVFDAEGVGSAIRGSLLRLPYTNFSQEYLNYEYKELTIPSLKGGHKIEKHALHIWPRGGFLMIALPNLDGSFTCTLFLKRTGYPSFSTLDSYDKVTAFFLQEFPDVCPLLEDFQDPFFKHPIGHLVTVKQSPWNFLGKVLLIGDAAHGIVPFYGQGLNCGFEDCSFLNQCMNDYPDDWEKIFLAYENGRKKNADAIAELSFDNFNELREYVADPVFVRKRELEALLEISYPNEFLSKYSMVTFSRMPYVEALIKGRLQDQVLMEACRGINHLSELNLQEVKRRLDQAVV